MSRSRLLYVTDVSKSAHMLLALKRDSFMITVYSSLAVNPEGHELPNLVLKYLKKFSKNRTDERIEGVIYRSVGLQQFLIPFLRHALNVTSGRKIISLVNNLTRVKLLFIIWKYDVIITTEEVFPFYLRKRQTVIVEVRGNLPISTELRCPILLDAPLFAFEDTRQFRFHWKRILRRADGFLVYSQSTHNQLELSGISSDKIAVRPLRELEELDYSNTPKNSMRDIQALYVGRDGLLKGLDIAVAVAQELEMTLAVVGNFSKKTNAWLKKFDFVTNYGSINHDEVLTLMSQSRILLSPGIESYGYAILEALESGCLVVSSKYCGAATLLSTNQNVFLSTSLDLHSFSKTTKSGLLQKSQVNQNFSEDLIEKSWENLLLKMLNA
jgi:glycosyltransferase involved in cell wall biosynthesis